MNHTELKSALCFPRYLNPQEIALRNEIHLNLIKSGMSLEEIEHYLIDQALGAKFDFNSTAKGGYVVLQNAGRYHFQDKKLVQQLFTFTLSDIALQQDSHDVIFKAIASGKFCRTKDISSSKLSFNGKNVFSLARWSDGSLKKCSDFKEWFSSRSTALSIFESTIRADDLEGAKMLLGSKRVEKILLDMIPRLFSYWKIPTTFRCNELIKVKSEKISDYVKTITNLCRICDLERVTENYRTELAVKAGHEVIYEISQLKTGETTTYVLAQLLVKDGADWFMGLKQLKEGHCAYLDYQNRERNPVDEVRYLAGFCNARTHPAIKGILSAIADEAILEAAIDPEIAMKLHQASGRRDLIDKVPPKYRRTILASDLGM